MEQTIGRYKIQREIGKGGMGIIYKALDPQSQKPVAIKVLPPNLVDRSTVERFSREARALIKLKCPSLVEVYDYGMEHGKHFFIMEYIEGETLKALIKRTGMLTINEVLDITEELAKALMYIHRQQMVHRDIKPANIMITPEHRVKLMDFGLVKMLGVTNVTIDGTSLGTVEYMSPEQITGIDIDHRTDIYCLGITVYEMLTGRLPYQGDNVQAIFYKHKNETPPAIRTLRPEVTVEMEMLTNRAMAKDRNLRYQSAEEILEDLARIRGKTVQLSTSRKQGDHSTIVMPASSSKKEEKPFSFNLPVAIAGLIVVSILAGVWFRKPLMERVSKISPGGFFKQQADQQLLEETESSLQVLEEAERQYALGLEYEERNSFDAAVAQFEQAVKLRKGYAPYYKSLALVYERQNKYKKALKTWNEVIKYDQSGMLSQEAKAKIGILQDKD